MNEFRKKSMITYAVVLGSATAIMLLVLLTGVASLNFTMIIFLVVVKFLAGFGTIIGVTSIIMWILKKFEKRFKGKENKKNVTILYSFFLIIIIGYIIYQGPVKIVQSIFSQGDADNLFDKIMFIYGIVWLLFSMYEKPLIKGKFEDVTTITLSEMIKEEVNQGVSGIKRWVYKKKKDYAKAEVEQQATMQKYLKTLRMRIAIVFLLFLGIGTVLFTLIAGAFILSWVHIFFFSEKKMGKLEKITLLCACIAISVIGALLPFVLEITPLYLIIKNYYFFIYIAQFAGFFIAAYLYLSRMLNPVLEKRKEEKLKSLKEEKKALKKQQKSLKKQKKKLEKEHKKGSKE